jgi:hypothetical protein
MTRKYIQKLWQLIQIGMTKEAAHPRDAGIAFGSLPGISFRIDIHRTEFKARERTTEETNPSLHEENRALRIKLDQEEEDGKKPAENKYQYKD